MINHARTLLMNVPGRSSQRQEPGEEYIPPTYVPVALPTYMINARRVLFGTSPDRYFLNFRVRELMRYLHQTELVHYVYALDPRVTYWPEYSAPALIRDAETTVEKVGGPNDTQLYFQGKLVADNPRGKSLRRFEISIASSGSDTVLNISGPEAVVTEAVIPAGSDLSASVPLGASGLRVRIGKPAAGARWTINTVAKPAPAITTTISTLELIGEPVMLGLFGALTTAQPYATFQNLWNDHPNPAYRLGGFILAMIYRTEELRRNGNG